MIIFFAASAYLVMGALLAIAISRPGMGFTGFLASSVAGLFWPAAVTFAVASSAWLRLRRPKAFHLVATLDAYRTEVDRPRPSSRRRAIAVQRYLR